MTLFLNKKLGIAKGYKHHRVPETTPRFDNTHPLVFTHFDLRPDNVMLGTDNCVWLIDFWGSGFYPVPFEHVSMM